ncbi:MAG: hypothetical protein CVU91_04175 [Firmicutes bacterium HGW-Firmicutes-16]|nr:MAG: hypothetical protein CVU91_04175 [Firmicutes bacterium HGW-Firmicutes-16]
MNEYRFNLGPPFNEAVIEVQHKNVKNVNLKVFRDLRIVLSVPHSVPNEWIILYLNKKSEWLTKQLSKYKQSSGYNNLNNIKSGSSTQLLGKDRRIKKVQSSTNYVGEDEKNIILYQLNVDDEELSQRILAKWWRDKANAVYSNELDMLYDKIFRKYNVDKPALQIRKMKTQWGSCTPSKSKITLNEYLLKADLRCIQYVVLHELTHLLYQYHNNNFYDFLTIQLPDWKTRKEQLDKEVVQGL